MKFRRLEGTIKSLTWKLKKKKKERKPTTCNVMLTDYIQGLVQLSGHSTSRHIQSQAISSA